MFSRSRLMGALVALGVACLVCAGSARAVDDTVIVIGNEQVLRIRVASGGYTAAQRAEALRRRLLEIYQALGRQNKPLQADDVTLDMTPGRPAVRVRGMLLLSVTAEDAVVNGSSLEDLSRVWHKRLRDALLRSAPLPHDPYMQTPDAGAASPSPEPSGAPSCLPSPSPSPGPGENSKFVP